MWHFTFCVNILRKTPGFLKLVEEIYGLLRKKIDTEYRLWAHLSCHLYIRNNIILNSTVQSLEKATA